MAERTTPQPQPLRDDPQRFLADLTVLEQRAYRLKLFYAGAGSEQRQKHRWLGNGWQQDRRNDGHDRREDRRVTTALALAAPFIAYAIALAAFLVSIALTDEDSPLSWGLWAASITLATFGVVA